MDSDWQRVMCLLDEISLRRLPKAVPSYVVASVIWRVCVLGGLFLNVFFWIFLVDGDNFFLRSVNFVEGFLRMVMMLVDAQSQGVFHTS